MNSRRSRSWLDRSQAILGSQSKKHGGDDHHVDAGRPPGACQRLMTGIHVIRALTGSALSHSGRPTRASRRVLAHDSDPELVLAGSQRACGAGWGGDYKAPPRLNPLNGVRSCRSSEADQVKTWGRLVVLVISTRCAMASMMDSLGLSLLPLPRRQPVPCALPLQTTCRLGALSKRARRGVVCLQGASRG